MYTANCTEYCILCLVNRVGATQVEVFDFRERISRISQANIQLNSHDFLLDLKALHIHHSSSSFSKESLPKKVFTLVLKFK